VHQHLAGLLADHGARIDAFFYCPYHPDGIIDTFTRTSEDRKPRPGMALAAAAKLGLDLASSWVVGDRPEDIGLAEAVGASAIFLNQEDTDHTYKKVWTFPSLATAAPFILDRQKRDNQP
jgi:histidinol phosphatase-like enzyme